MKFGSFDKMEAKKPEFPQPDVPGKAVEAPEFPTLDPRTQPDVILDDNGKRYRKEDGTLLPNNRYILDGVEYKTDDNGSVYQCDGKYYPGNWFVLKGNLYVTDPDGEVIGGDAEGDGQNGEASSEQQGSQELTEEDRSRIKEETGWSDEIIDHIQNMEQYELLKNANLVEAEINGRKCLIRTDIDLDKKWDTGKFDAEGNPVYETNRERMEAGKPPLDENGKPIELHHLGQKADSPLVELTVEEHRTGERSDGTKNQRLWHDNAKDSEVHGAGNSWTQERESHWETRAEQMKGDNHELDC